MLAELRPGSSPRRWFRLPRTAALDKPIGAGAAVTAAVFGLYWMGSRRAYGFDASVSVHRFIATSSLLDPFRRQAVYNNHPLFSFLDHVVYSVVHSSDERILRIVPIVASALSAGLLAAALVRRVGLVAALAAAAVLPCSPVRISTRRDVTGDSL